MQSRLPLLALAPLLLGACAARAPQPISSASAPDFKETSAMPASTQTNPSTPPPLSQSTRTAAELLQGLLHLFRTSKTADDFGMEAVSKALGVPMQQFDPHSFGAGSSLTSNWTWSLEIRDKPARDVSYLDFSFRPQPSLGPNAAPAMTDICQLDFDEFSAKLEQLGFVRQSYFAEHSRHIKDIFNRDDMRIEVYPEGEANEPTQKISHSCVKNIRVF